MSDPQPARLKKKPARAEPLQPDLPGRGDETPGDTFDKGSTETTSAADIDSKSTEKAKARSDDALKNVNEGYD